jgi:formylglycine-generating enzyme required for sulfatase activity
MDAYTQGTVSVPFEFSAAEFGTLVSEIPGVSLEWLSRGRGRADGASQKLNVSFKDVPFDASVTVSGSSTLTCQPLISAPGWGSFHWRTNDAGSIDAGAFMGLEMIADANISISVASEQHILPPKSLHLIKRKILAPRIISPTVWVWPVIDLFIEVGISAEAKGTSEIIGNFKGSASYSWTSAQGGIPNVSWEKSGTASMSGSGKVSASVLLPVFQISFIPYVPTEDLLPEVFLKVIPAKLDLSAECKSGDNVSNLVLDYEASLRAGVDFSFLGKKISKVEGSLDLLKSNLWNGKGPNCPTPTPTPNLNTPPSNPTLGQEWMNPKDGSVLVWVPGSTFQMGTNKTDPDKWLDTARPVHSVTLSGYWIGKYETSVKQYRQFCTDTGRAMPTAPAWGWIDNHPIGNVTWNDATAYAEWAGLKLPTEAQWEYAAKGNTDRSFPWGDTWDASKCISVLGGASATAPVGSRPAGASPFGVQDMAGNLVEWCRDWWVSKYGSAAETNPTGPVSGSVKVRRGGTWRNDKTTNYNCSVRGLGAPTAKDGNEGFRLVYEL